MAKIAIYAIAGDIAFAHKSHDVVVVQFIEGKALFLGGCSVNNSVDAIYHIVAKLIWVVFIERLSCLGLTEIELQSIPVRVMMHQYFLDPYEAK